MKKSACFGILLLFLSILNGSDVCAQTFYNYYSEKNIGLNQMARKDAFPRFDSLAKSAITQSPAKSQSSLQRLYNKTIGGSDQEYIALLEVLLGDVNKSLGAYDQAGRFYYKAMLQFLISNDTSKLIIINTALAELNRAVGEHQTALLFLETAENLYRLAPSSPGDLAAIQATRSAILFEILAIGLDKHYAALTKRALPDSTNRMLKKKMTGDFFANVRSARKIAGEVNDSLLLIKTGNLLGKYHNVQQQYDLVLPYYMEALDIIRKSGIIHEEPLVLSNLTYYYIDQGAWEDALFYALEAYAKAKESGVKFYRWQTSNSLSVIYQARGNLQESLRYKKEEADLLAAIYNEKARKQLYLSQLKFHSKQQELEIKVLKDEQRYKNTIERLVFIFFTILVIILGVVIILMYFRWKDAKKRRQEIEAENILKADLLEKAESANKAKNEFLANVSHEIRTPMSAMLGYSELLGNTPLNTLQKDYIKGIDHSGKILLTLINDLLDLSRLEAGKTELSNSTVDLSRLCNELEHILHYQLQKHELQLVKIIHNPGAHLFILDDIRLKQVLLNLIGNSIKYTPKGSITLTIDATPSGHLYDLHFNLTDTGIGIKQEQLTRIFEPFYKASAPVTRERAAGFGLGLTIVKKLVEMMNGKIGIKSVPGQGTQVFFTLKGIQSSETTVINDKPIIADENLIFLSSKILIAEDNLVNMNFLLSFFKNSACQIKTASDGYQVLDILRNFKPDIILLDINMPGMDGIEVMQKIAREERLKNIPVVALTAYSRNEIQKDVRNLFVGYLRKPVSKSLLFGMLSQHLPFIRERAPESADKSSSDKTRLSEEEINFINNHMLPMWTKISHLMSKDEMEDFAEKVGIYGEQHSISELGSWAAEIKSHGANFDIKHLFDTFREFPDIISNLK